MTQEQKSRSRTMLHIDISSLMWPPGKPPVKTPDAPWAGDLGLDTLVRTLTLNQRYAQFTRGILSALTTDPEVIAWRQSVLNDFLHNPALVERMETLLPRFMDLRQGTITLGNRKRSLMQETTDRLAELDMYLSLIQDLEEAIRDAQLGSPAMRALRENLVAMANDENVQALREELPRLKAPIQNLASMTIGVNLDSQLRPTSAVLLAINDHRVGEPKSFLDRLLGVRTSPDDETGIAPLHFMPPDPEQRSLSPFYQDLERLLIQSLQPVARALGRYVRVSSAPLVSIEHELAFYVAAVGMMRKLEAQGVVFCRPEIAPLDERVTTIEDLVSISLVLRNVVPVPSEARFDDTGRIAILNGPNSGGKTTYVQAVGLAHILFQAGLFVPARTARLSPVDAIYTHFPALETQQQGRLAEEAARLRDIFMKATSFSLVLLNESLASTTASEALYLAQDLMCGLRAIGVRAIYATHLVELAEHIPEMQSTVEGPSTIFGLVAGVEFSSQGEATPTFKVTRGVPFGRGYAKEIARRHGISLEQILEARRGANPEA